MSQDTDLAQDTTQSSDDQTPGPRACVAPVPPRLPAPLAPNPPMWHSPTLGEVFVALSSVHAELPQLPALGTNLTLGNAYISLATILVSGHPILAKHGLTVLQMPHGMALRTVLGHRSGEFIACDTPILLDDELSPMQSYARAASFARRIGATAVLGIAVMDNDGERPSGAGKTAFPAGVRASAAHADGAGAAPPSPVRGFGLEPTLLAIRAKRTEAELDAATERVKAAFKGDDLTAALKEIDARRAAIKAGELATT